MARPTDDIEWATDGGASVTEPSALKKTQGWIFGEKPPAAWLNWLLRALWRWVDFLDVRMTVGHEDNGAHKAASITLANMADITEGKVIGRGFGVGTGAPSTINEVTTWVGGGHIQKDVAGITILGSNFIGREGSLEDVGSQQASTFAVSSVGVGGLLIYPPSNISSDLSNYVPLVISMTAGITVAVQEYSGPPDSWLIYLTDDTGAQVDGDSFYIAFLLVL